MKLTTFAVIATLLTGGAAVAIENGDPFSTGDSYGPRGGDFGAQHQVLVPAERTTHRAKIDCKAQFLTADEWMACSPEFQSPAPGLPKNSRR